MNFPLKSFHPLGWNFEFVVCGGCGPVSCSPPFAPGHLLITRSLPLIFHASFTLPFSPPNLSRLFSFSPPFVFTSLSFSSPDDLLSRSLENLNLNLNSHHPFARSIRRVLTLILSVLTFHPFSHSIRSHIPSVLVFYPFLHSIRSHIHSIRSHIPSVLTFYSHSCHFTGPWPLRSVLIPLSGPFAFHSHSCHSAPFRSQTLSHSILFIRIPFRFLPFTFLMNTSCVCV